MSKQALVTGAAGFVGRHMVKELTQRGYDVHGVDIESGNSSARVDVTQLFRSGQLVPCYDLVVHCAYYVGGRAAIDGKPQLLAKNLELDATLFDWAVFSKQKRVLYFSSSSVYPVHLQDGLLTMGMSESNVDHSGYVIGQPDANYGWAKMTGERLAANARESGLSVHVVRPFSGYGVDQDDTYPFRAFTDRAKRQDNPFTIWGDGKQVRDWIHIDDVVAGAMAVVDAGYQEPVNLCTGIGTSMQSLAEMCCYKAGYVPQFEFNTDAPQGVMYRVGDPSLLSYFYAPKISLARGVELAMSKVTTRGRQTTS